MRFRRMADLILLNLLVVILILSIISFPSGILRIILGVPFIIFSLGYSLSAALFPKRETISGIERMALSLGLSIALVSLIGLVINYTPWGINLGSILCSTAFFIFFMSVIAWVRRGRLTDEESFSIRFHLVFPGLNSRTSAKRLSVSLSVILVLAALAAMGTLVYTIASPKVGESFTEFYVLGSDGAVYNHPEILLGDEVNVRLGIINNENEPVDYKVEIMIDGEKIDGVGPVTLEHEEKWEEELSFTPTKVNPAQRVDFLLYKGADTEPYRILYLYLEVKGDE